jgi:hypothetical protein
MKILPKSGPTTPVRTLFRKGKLIISKKNIRIPINIAKRPGIQREIP